MSQVRVGIGEYDIVLKQVGGEISLMNLSRYVSDLDWERMLDGFGFASLTLADLDRGCCEVINRVRPWLHEVHIWRNGGEVFSGPVSVVSIGTTSVIQAVGFAAWLDVRFVRDVINFSVANGGLAAPVSDVVGAIVTSALRVADPNLLPFLDVRACATPHERFIDPTPVPRDLAWSDHLAEMVGTYVHMAQHGRSLIFWCVNTCIYNMPSITSYHATNDPPLVRDGRDFSTLAAVYNEKPDTGPIAGSAGGVHPDWNVLVERKYEDQSVSTNAAAAAGAAGRVDGDIRSGTGESESTRFELQCEAPVDMVRSVPGACFTVTYSGCADQVLQVRLDSIGATFSQESGEVPYIQFSEKVDTV